MVTYLDVAPPQIFSLITLAILKQCIDITKGIKTYEKTCHLEKWSTASLVRHKVNFL